MLWLITSYCVILALLFGTERESSMSSSASPSPSSSVMVDDTFLMPRVVSLAEANPELNRSYEVARAVDESREIIPCCCCCCGRLLPSIRVGLKNSAKPRLLL